MAKGKSPAPVVIDTRKFLLPKMEFFIVDETTGEGFYVKEIGGVHLLEFKELIETMQKAGDELTPSQAVELMCRFVLFSACDANGRNIFSEEDVDLLKAKSPVMLEDAATRAMILSGMSSEVVGEVTSNLPNDLTASSSTD